MRYPFYPYKEDVGFLEPASYGPHEGSDVNGLGGGDTDCGFALYPITNGRVIHVSFSQTGYGNIVIFEITGPWGTYWVRYAHCDDIFFPESTNVLRSDILAEMGDIGNATACHLHYDVFIKLPPMNNGKVNWRWYTKKEDKLREYMTDPIAFIKEYKLEEGVIQEEPNDLVEELTASLEECSKSREKCEKEQVKNDERIADCRKDRKNLSEKLVTQEIINTELAEDLENCQEDCKKTNIDLSALIGSVSRATELTSGDTIKDVKTATEAIHSLSVYKKLYTTMKAKKNSSSTAPVEAIKEVARWVILGAFSAAVAYALGQITDLPQDSTTMILTLLLRGADKWLHEQSKNSDITRNGKHIKGLLPF